MITQDQAKELVLRSPFERRPMSAAFIADRAATRALRKLARNNTRVPANFKLGDKLDWIRLWEEMPVPMAGGASYFNLVVDTTGPGGASLSLNGGATYATSATISATLSTSDNPVTGYQIMIWGNVNTATNASIQSTQGGSAWITPTWNGSGPFTATQSVDLSTGDGSKSISARIRDDVWNETSTLTQSITLDTTVPTVNITTGPDATKVSTVAGKRTVNFTFTVGSEAITAWEVMVVASGASTHGTGTLIGTTNGSTGVSGGAKASSATQAVAIDARDVVAASAGDGTKVIKVFVQDAAGNWSTV